MPFIATMPPEAMQRRASVMAAEPRSGRSSR